MELDHIDKEILRFLIKYGDWANTNYIAESVGISWKTAERHLIQLSVQNYVIFGLDGNKHSWWIMND
ncbi:winged helix-turn-helix transcriptional regulator [Candidatus Micrarchaeota archaeon]|nr:winged helix-turn-helix transcriptional regulator [Candidatus Micrarchaeota archaeon]